MKKQIVASVMAVLSVMSLTFSSCQMLTKTEYAYPEVSINEKGELIFTYPDGRIQNVGVVKGADGMDGTNGINGKDGVNGISINNARINEKGELVLTYSTGESVNLGVVQGANGANGSNGTDGINGTNGIDGKDGVGIQEAKINDKGELVLTYTNGEIVNLGVVKGADGSKLTIGANGHFYIDGKDTFYVAGERDVIKISSDGKKFTEETQEKVTIRNVPATTKVFDESKMDVTYGYNEAGEVTSKRYKTSNIEDVYAFYDEVTKAEGYPYHGLLLLPDTAGLKCFNTTYSFSYITENDEYYPNTFFIMGTILGGIIQFDDGREYECHVQIDSSLTLPYSGSSYYIKDRLPEYVCYDKDAFLKESIVSKSPGEYVGNWWDSSMDFMMRYETKNENNPYKEIVSQGISEDKIAVFVITIFDSERSGSKYRQLTEEELQLVCGQVYNLIKDSFVVYDYYDYYSKQFEENISK